MLLLSYLGFRLHLCNNNTVILFFMQVKHPVATANSRDMRSILIGITARGCAGRIDIFPGAGTKATESRAGLTVYPVFAVRYCHSKAEKPAESDAVIHVFSMNVLQDSTQPFFYVTGGVILALFLGVGIWSLHVRFHLQQEWSVRRQLVVLGMVLLFFGYEIITVQQLIQDDIALFIFTLLGLLVAGMALYGHLVVSLLSRILVELILPDHPGISTAPQLEHAAQLEKQGDWEGALKEYFVLVHIYPGNPAVLSRITANLICQKRYTEASHWFDRLVTYAERPDEARALLEQMAAAFTDEKDLPLLRNGMFCFLQRFPQQTEIKAQLAHLDAEDAGRPRPLGTGISGEKPGSSSFQSSAAVGSALLPMRDLSESTAEVLRQPEAKELSAGVGALLQPLQDHPIGDPKR